MVQNLVLITCWFGLMFGSLQIQQIEMGHWFCGKWGCGPPANALISYHLFWLAALVPPVWFFRQNTKLPWLVIGKVVAGIAILFLIGFGIYDVLSINQAYYQAGYVWQRYLLSVASLIDVPVIQTLLIGVGLAVFGNSKSDSIKQALKDAINQDIVPASSE